MIFRVNGLDCAEEAAILGKALGPEISGAQHLAFDVINGRMTILDTAGDISDDKVLKLIEEMLFLMAIIFGVWLVAPKAWSSARCLSPDMNLLMMVANALRLLQGKADRGAPRGGAQRCAPPGGPGSAGGGGEQRAGHARPACKAREINPLLIGAAPPFRVFRPPAAPCRRGHFFKPAADYFQALQAFRDALLIFALSGPVSLSICQGCVLGHRLGRGESEGAGNRLAT